MAGYEELGPLEGMWAPLSVRLEMRQMFDRWLSRSRHMPPITWQDEMVDELSLLDLSEHYRLEYPGAAKNIAKIWDESDQRIADGGPSFDELVCLGWVFFDGARWIVQHTPRGTSPHITYPSPNTKTFLTGLSKVRLVAKSDTPPPAAQAFAARILAEDWFDRQLPVKAPAWLAGRIWERLCPKPLPRASDDSGNAMYAATFIERGDGDSLSLLDTEVEAIDRAFLEWSLWCNILGVAGRWDNGWNPIEMRYCRDRKSVV